MRKETVERNTKETKISCSINLDGTGVANISTGIGFLNHMLELFVHHSLIDMDLKTDGDINVDLHHSVEDTAYAIAQATTRALGEKKGIKRFGSAYAPLDEALSRVVVDFSGRPGLSWNVEFTKDTINDFDLQLLREFFQGFTNKSLATIHIDNLKGENAHHQAETIFKAFALALKQSCSIDEQKLDQIPSTKGSL